MTATAAPPAEAAAPARRASKLPLILGLLLALAGGGGGFLAVRLGLLGGAEPAEGGEAAGGDAPGLPAEMAFVALPPIVVNLPGGPQGRFLRFLGQVEVAPADLDAVAALVPRIVDVLNGYLRAVGPEELADPAALLRLRSQMLRRVQVVAGGERARDLLVMEFVVN